jgi:hypothetical protein
MGQPETILAQISPEHTILKICIIGQKEKNSTEKPGRYFKWPQHCHVAAVILLNGKKKESTEIFLNEI